MTKLLTLSCIRHWFNLSVSLPLHSSLTNYKIYLVVQDPEILKLLQLGQQLKTCSVHFPVFWQRIKVILFPVSSHLAANHSSARNGTQPNEGNKIEHHL